ncbi:MAG: ribonuclease HI [Selenomonadaceae bacterium]|nr:ribonuclease HI [Selenomonadaceae bacterium]
MAKQKYYAVRVGRQTGVFSSWSECEAQVKGFPGAQYKSFPTKKEAADFVGAKEPDKNIPFPSAKVSKAPVANTPLKEAAPCDYIIYTDGSCLKNPDGPGGWAAVITDCHSGEVQELSGGHPSTTNNRMELSAAIEALSSVSEPAEIKLYTDSQYLKNAFTKYWLRNWQRNGWLTSTGEPVKNQDLWRKLSELVRKHRVIFQWVKGHVGNHANERCDELAKQEAAKYKKWGFAPNPTRG